MSKLTKLALLIALLLSLLIPVIAGSALWWADNKIKGIQEQVSDLQSQLECLNYNTRLIAETQNGIKRVLVNQEFALRNFNKNLMRDMQTFLLED